MSVPPERGAEVLRKLWTLRADGLTRNMSKHCGARILLGISGVWIGHRPNCMISSKGHAA